MGFLNESGAYQRSTTNDRTLRWIISVSVERLRLLADGVGHCLLLHWSLFKPTVRLADDRYCNPGWMSAAVAQDRNPGLRPPRHERAVGTPGMNTISEWNSWKIRL